MSYDWVGQHEGKPKMDEVQEDDLIEYRCSRCQQIGGDNEIGPYKGCPKNVLDDEGNLGPHDMNGGLV